MAERCLRDLFEKSFLAQGKRRAIRFLRDGSVETLMPYDALDRDSNRMARTFLEKGVRKGDRVILYLDKCLAFVVAHLALQKIGAVSVPLNPGFKKSEMAYFIQDAEAALILAGPAQASLLEDIDPSLNRMVCDPQAPYQALHFFRNAPEDLPREDIGPEDVGLIIYTSGTTGRPKGAMLTQKNLVRDALNIISIWEISPSDMLCHALPLFHVHGLCFALHTALGAGAGMTMLDAFKADRVLDVLAGKDGESACSIFMAVPAMYGKMMDAMSEKTYDFKHMRLWTSGSAPLLVKDFKRIKDRFGKEPVEREGMSETGMNFSNPLRGRKKPGSIGKPLPGLRVRMVNPETHRDVAPGQTGEFWLKGPAVSPGYWRKPKETEAAFEEGWFKTGDLGRVDQDGYYYLTDRIKHIIISGGENISPKEIEGVLNRFDDVAESCVVGLPDDQWGERVVAAVVGKPGFHMDVDQLRQACREHLHDWKCPKAFRFVDALPKNAMGKVLKEEVKALFH